MIEAYLQSAINLVECNQLLAAYSMLTMAEQQAHMERDYETLTMIRSSKAKLRVKISGG